MNCYGGIHALSLQEQKAQSKSVIRKYKHKHLSSLFPLSSRFRIRREIINLVRVRHQFQQNSPETLSRSHGEPQLRRNFKLFRWWRLLSSEPNIYQRKKNPAVSKSQIITVIQRLMAILGWLSLRDAELRKTTQNPILELNTRKKQLTTHQVS